MSAIKVVDLFMKFKNVNAVNGISFDVDDGEIFGLLGPNGAGKTTTMRMLATLLSPTSGSASVNGIDVTRDKNAVRRSIGMVFQEPALDRQLTGRENLDFHAWMYGMKKAERKTRMAEVLKLVELDGRENDLVEDYSGGMQRRLEIARGLMHFPKVLFLDEPTLGLDTQTRRRIWNYIQQMNRSSGTTVVLTTHYMEEADVLCGRVGIMDKGVIVALDSPASLKNLIGADVLELETDGGDCGAFDGLDFVKKTVKHQNRISLSVVNGERKIPSLLEFARDRGISVRSVELHRPSLEDVFLHYTGSTIQERDASPADALPGRER